LETSPENNADRTLVQFELAETLIDHHDLHATPESLNEAIDLIHSALAAGSPTVVTPPSLLDSLGGALLRRFKLDSRQDDLEEAIAVHRRSLIQRRSSNLPCWPSLHGLGNSLLWRHLHLGDAKDLEDAIATLRYAVDTDGSNIDQRVLSVRSLGECLLRQYDINRVLEVVDEGVFWARRAVEWTLPSNQLYGGCLGTLGYIIYWRFQEAHTALADLHEAIQLMRAAVAICLPSVHQHTRRSLHLSLALLTRFEQLGELDDIDESIAVARLVLDNALPGSNTGIWARSYLAQSLRQRYNRSKSSKDLDEAIALIRAMVSASDMSSNSWALGTAQLLDCLCLHFESQPPTLDELSGAISLAMEYAAHVPATHCDRSKGLYGFARLLYLQSQYSGSADKVLEAISLNRDALKICPLDHFEYAEILDSLATCLRAQWQHSTEQEYLYEAVEHRRRCSDITPSVRPFHAQQCIRLANDLLSLPNSEGKVYRAEAMSLFSIAVQHRYSTVHDRLKYAIQWTKEASSEPTDNDSLTDAYQHIIQLLPRIASWDMTVDARLEALRRYPGLAIDAALHAIEMGNPQVAVEYLEQGRSVFWNCALRLRTTFHGLPLYLAEELEKISRELETHSYLENSSNIHMSETEVARRRRTVERFETLLQEARSIPSHERLLLPEPYENLSAAAQDGPVVILMAGHSSSWAIVISSSRSNPAYLSLPTASPTRLSRLRNRLSDMARNARDSRWYSELDRKMVKARPHNYPTTSMWAVLAEIWVTIVGPVIYHLGLKVR
jgi:tetratricopeptide (TPR) repeat protein